MLTFSTESPLSLEPKSALGMPACSTIYFLLTSPLLQAPRAHKTIPFMQNKANLLNAQMNLTTVITKDYEKNPLQPPRKTKPIGEKAKINLLVHVGGRQTSTKGQCAHKTTPNYAKQSQFAKGQNEPNRLSDKGLRKKTPLEAQKKQSQFKANSRKGEKSAQGLINRNA